MRFELEIAPLDLDLTLGCGQTFRWRCQPDGSWSGVLGDQAIILSQTGSFVSGEASPGGSRIGSRVEKFLRSQDDVSAIQRELRKDPVLAKGAARMKGLRITKIDEWECLVSYVLATYANIPRIMKMVDSVAAAFGPRIAKGVYAFPDRKRLGKASVRDLNNLGLGYRAKYVKQICSEVEDETMDRMKRLQYEALRNELIELPGVGEKVADCVSLFGFGKLEAFPIDVWIERALKRLYGQTGSYSSLRHFANCRFGKYSGYAQEYIYHNERMRGRTGACAFLEE